MTIRARCSALLLSAALTACSGGGTAFAPHTQPVQSGSSAVPVTFSINVPKSASSGSRQPRYISPGTKSTAVFGWQGSSLVVGSYANCSTTACTNTFAVPPGLTHFRVELYGGPSQTGGTLSVGQTDAVIVAGTANQINITFDGTPASVVLSVANSMLSAGQSTTVTVNAKDATGNTIIGPGNFSGPFAVTANDPTITVSPTTVTAPGQSVTATYVGGSAIPVVTVGATFPGMASSAITPATISVATAPISLSPNWVSAGPRLPWASGKLQAFAMDLSHRNTMYVGGGWGTGAQVLTDAGVYRTTDGGATWNPAVNGLSDTIVNSLWLDQNNPSTIVAATQLSGLYQSTNSGATWTNVYPVAQATQLLFYPASGSLFAATADGVLASNDSGGTWRSIVNFGSPVNAIDMAAGIMYAGTGDGSLYSNSGGTWHKTTTLPSAAHQIVVDPLAPNTVFVSVAGIYNGIYTQGLSVSNDGGTTFRQAVFPTDIRGAQSMAMSLVTPHKLYVDGVGGLITTDGGNTFTKGGASGDSRLLTLIPGTTPGTEISYVASDQGLNVSSDLINWTILTPNLSVGYATDVAVSGTTIVAPLQDFTPAMSYDGGASWTQPNGHFYEDGQVVINPGNPSYCYMMDPWSSAGYGYTVSSDGCRTFSSQPSLQTAGYGGDVIAVDPTHPNTVYLATKGGLLKSVDYGLTYNILSSPATSVAAVAVAPTDSNTIVIASGSGAGVYVTHDGGTTWTTGTRSGSTFSAGTIAISPQSSNVILAGGLDYYGVTIYRSTDGGATYTQLADPIASLAKFRDVKDLMSGQGLTIPPAFDPKKYYFPNANRLRFNPANPAASLLALGTSLGVFISSDYGDHWTNITSNAISKTVSGVQWSNGFLYLGTIGEGILRSTTRLQSEGRRIK